jgi:hypothetical protein
MAMRCENIVVTVVWRTAALTYMAADDLELLAVEKMVLECTSGKLIETGRIYGTKLYMIKEMCIGLYVKYPLFLSDFNYTWIFSTIFRKKLLKCEIS